VEARALAVTGVQAHLAMLGTMEAIKGATERVSSSRSDSFHWVWVLVVGIVAVTTAAGIYYCQQEGYDGFTGEWKYEKDANGGMIGINVACYKN
jgi:hypothetical protein